MGAEELTSQGDGERKLREAIRKWRELKAGPQVDGVDVSPKCVFGMVTRDVVDDLAGEIEDVKAELAWIRRIIVVTIVTAAVGTLLRLGGLQ
ncbi:MAG: hypothetical protein ACUVR2_10260 [Anaerolineae bacterium]